MKTMGFELKGQNFVVTGAARGIGLAISRRLTELGAKISGWDLDQSSMSKESTFSHCVKVDVTYENSVVSATEETASEEVFASPMSTSESESSNKNPRDDLDAKRGRVT